MGQKRTRLYSIDAYRGFVMLAMASAGLAIPATVSAFPELIAKNPMWETAAYQLEHVAWAGCSFWDLIQPSFMFLVGVSLPFSYEARSDKDESGLAMFLHAFARSLFLVVLGIVLYSQASGEPFIRFKLVNVLTQIGLGYMFVYVLVNRGLWTHVAVIAVILIGYGAAFYFYETPTTDHATITNVLRGTGDESVFDTDAPPHPETQQYTDHRSPWNKHVNAAGAFDRWFLNLFPRNEEPIQERGFWLNRGGYQTLNFVPSIATMIFGLMAGMILISDYTSQGKLLRLFGLSAICFVLALSMDTELWPVQIPGVGNWSICPIVKKIWTPTWALFSAGWAFAILATFYLVTDVIGFRIWAFPLKVVGMNSIVAYCLAQLTQGWFSKLLEKTLRTVDSMAGTTSHAKIFGDGMYVEIYQSIAFVAFMWIICFWLYRRRLFIRV